LYDEIWNEQPPGLAYTLAPVIQLFGNKVGAARYVVLLFSGLLVWGACQYLRMILGNKYAVAGAVLIFTLPKYLRLSVSVMQAIPNLALAILCLFFLTKWHKSHKYRWLILSSVLLGASILTKLFTLILAPVFVIGILLGEYTRSENKKQPLKYLFPPFLWGMILSVILVLSWVYLIGIDNLDLIIGTHLDARGFDFQSNLSSQLESSYPFILLAMIGLFNLILKREWLGLYLAAWISVYVIVFANYYPVRYHYIILISVPSAILGAIPAVNALELVQRSIRIAKQHLTIKEFRFKVLSLIGLALVFFQLPGGTDGLTVLPSISGSGLGLNESDTYFLSLMREYRAETNWIVTDRPMFAFRARLNVPPELAVFSRKRLDTNNLTQKDIIEIIDQYQPEQIFFARFNFEDIEANLEPGYNVVHSYKGTKLYIRNDLWIKE
jgi:4-amino-4-deoxy-L-arabinose transferase-like glycosyltransferase